MATRVLTPEDLETYKQIRLEALLTDPDAFGSNYAREVQFDDATWLSRLGGFEGRAGVVLVDELDGIAAGIVGIGFNARPNDVELWSMWVAPNFRRRGVAQRLVDAALAWAREHSAGTVSLWVVRSNASAIALYERNGFAATGEVDALPDNPCAAELAMQLTLS